MAGMSLMTSIAAADEPGYLRSGADGTVSDGAQHERAVFERKDRGWYFGFGIGYTDDQGLNETDTGFKLFGGYQFSRYFALEGALVGLTYEVGPANDSKDGLAVEAVGILPIGKRFGLLGKLGFFSWDEYVGNNTYNCYSFTGGYTCYQNQTEIDNGTSAVYGVGLQYYVTKRWSLRTEWERFTDVGEGDVDLISFNGVFHF
jgi:OOP family OmpA-OmpF porin